jgi:GNAT superfamily N-acetyltransferase
MSGERIIVREAEPHEFRIITDFVLAMARDSEGVTLNPEIVEAGVQAALADCGKGVYYVAEADQGLIGQVLVTTEWSDWNCCEYWWLQSVYVRPEWRRRGVFGLIYRHIVDRARESRAAAIRLYVHRDNEAAILAYRRHGMSDSEYIVMEQTL